jgi:hypothetical protein
MENITIIPNYAGVMIHDYWASYSWGLMLTLVFRKTQALTLSPRAYQVFDKELVEELCSEPILVGMKLKIE